MSLPLSYPSFKCVLEHLDAVKRVHIIARAPDFQKIDKLIQLRLKDFYIFDSKKITINNLTIKYDKDVVQFATLLKTFSRQRGKSREDKMKKLINVYFCERSIIHVHRLCWCDRVFPTFLPVNLKFRVNVLTAPFRDEFDTAIPFIDPRSFPLKTLATIPETSTFDDQIVKSAETLNLTLFNHEIITVEDLKKLNNKEVVFECFNSYSRIDIVPLIKYHIETKKDINTTFVITTRDDKNFLNEMLRGFELTFGEHRSDLDGVNERFIPGLPKFSIPINNESRIQLYVIEDQGVGGRWKIVMKPVSGVSGH